MIVKEQRKAICLEGFSYSPKELSKSWLEHYLNYGVIP